MVSPPRVPEPQESPAPTKVLFLISGIAIRFPAAQSASAVTPLLVATPALFQMVVSDGEV